MHDTSDSPSEQSANVAANEAPQYFSKFKRPSFSVDKRENPSTKAIPNNEDMPDENLVSDDAALQASQLTFSETVQQIEKKLAQIHVILSQNPELATIRMVDFNPTSVLLRSVREAVWNIYNATAKFIGRNSQEAVVADTAHLFSTRTALFNVDAAETTKGSRDSNIGTWIKNYVSPQLDSDMKEYVVPKPNKHISAIKPYLRLGDNLYKRVRVYSS
jgi:hypothetical protein